MFHIKMLIISVLFSYAAYCNDKEQSELNILLKYHSASKQVIVVANEKLATYRKRNGLWIKVFKKMPVVVGKFGIAQDGEKKEGDGKTPSGIYTLTNAFGYAWSLNTRLLYTQSTDDTIWVDDVDSKYYNKCIKKSEQSVLPKSFEIMRRKDHLYKWGIVINYNTDPVVKGLGSAIFLHIWRNASAYTDGCIAMSEDNIISLLGWLDPAQKPVIAIIP